MTLFDGFGHPPPPPDSLLTHSPKWAAALAALDARGKADKYEHLSLLYHDMAGDSDVVFNPPDSASRAFHVDAYAPKLDSTQLANWMLTAIGHNHPWHGHVWAGDSPEIPNGGYFPGDPSPDDINMAKQTMIPSYVTNDGSVYRIGETGQVQQWKLPQVLASLGLTPAGTPSPASR